MSDRLTAEPGTLEFLKQLLEIAQESDHPMDKAAVEVLSKQIGEAEVVRQSLPTKGAGRLDNVEEGENGS